VPAAMPPRTRLYSLEPIGIGTPQTESLTSYISRLAAAHSVRVRDLVVGELLAHVRCPHLADGPHTNLLGAFWRSETRALNSTRSLARRMVHGLEEKTGRRDLRFLTLLTWSEVLPVHPATEDDSRVVPRLLPGLARPGPGHLRPTPLDTRAGDGVRTP